MNREAFVAQVATAMMGKLDELERYLSMAQGGLRQAIYTRAREFAELLDEPSTAAGAARSLMAGLYGHADVPLSFWRTEAGQAVARAIGFHREAVPNLAAAAILGVSRQRVYQMRQEGSLRPVEGQHAVTPASVREALLGAGARR